MKPSNDQINGETDGPSRCPVNKPPRLKNYANGSENVDTLHKRAPQVRRVLFITYFWS